MSLPRFAIKDGTVTHRQVKGFDFFEQRALVELVDRDGQILRLPCVLEVGAPDKGYAPGVYVLADSSFSVGKFSKLTVKPVLVPAPAK